MNKHNNGTGHTRALVRVDIDDAMTACVFSAVICLPHEYGDGECGVRVHTRVCFSCLNWFLVFAGPEPNSHVCVAFVWRLAVLKKIARDSSFQ